MDDKLQEVRLRLAPQLHHSLCSDALQTYRKLITANHILDHHGVVDAYGHISGTLTVWPR